MKALIQKLVETPGPSGYETQIREVIRAEIEPFTDAIRTDNMGNLIAEIGPENPEAPRIMLAAHMDEIAVMVSHIDEEGFVRFFPIGGLRPDTCIGGRVLFLNGTRGVINMERLDGSGKLPAFDQLYIDLGLSSREGAPVRVGDVAVFDRPFMELEGRLVGKSMDDRIGVAVLVETLKQLAEQAESLPQRVLFVFSVQEEVGTRGATTAAYGLDPDLGLAVDVCLSGDTPRGFKLEVGLGKGPAIKVRDALMLSDPRVIDWMVETASRLGLPYQLEVMEVGGTDARAIQLTRAGVPSGCLSIPCRYVHSPSEMVDYQDVLNAVRLLVGLLEKPTPFTRK